MRHDRNPGDRGRPGPRRLHLARFGLLLLAMWAVGSAVGTVVLAGDRHIVRGPLMAVAGAVYAVVVWGVPSALTAAALVAWRARHHDPWTQVAMAVPPAFAAGFALRRLTDPPYPVLDLPGGGLDWAGWAQEAALQSVVVAAVYATAQLAVLPTRAWRYDAGPAHAAADHTVADHTVADHTGQGRADQGTEDRP